MRFPSIFRCENVSFREGKAQHVGFAELRFGPRALGHRSLLAVPDSDKMRDRPLALKGLVKRVSYGSNPANQLRLVVYLIIYRVLYIQTVVV